MENIVIDGANVAYAYLKSPPHKKKFSYEAYPEVAKEVCQRYGFEAILTMPRFRFKKLREKCMDDGICDLIERMVDEELRHLTGDATGDDDREALALAMRLEVKLLTNDKKMNEHFDKYSKEDRKIAEEWFDNNRIGYFFSENNMILIDCIPTCLKKGATA